MSKALYRLLLVDDDEDEHLLVGDMLRERCTEDFELSWLPTYEEGRNAILSGNYDVCLLDYRLGGRTGLELLREVQSRLDHTQVILMTGLNDRGIDLTATEAGAADYLVKGEFSAALLERSIRFAVERGRSLNALRRASEVESRNLIKSTFIASMSHETRTPLNVVMGMADMLRDSNLRPDQMGYVETLRRASSDLLLLLNDILDLSSLDEGNLELQRISFKLEEIIDQIVEVNAAKARAKSLRLLYRVAPELSGMQVVGDPVKLRQILNSLLGNAVKFTPAGDILLTVSLAAAPAADPAFLRVEFTAADTGVGIPATKLESIFDDFTQADASLTRKHGGVGLGLSIAKRLVQAMEGNLSVESREGQGSTFRFAVNLERATADGTAAATGQFHGTRVLLVDEHPVSRTWLEEMLQGWGFNCDAYAPEAAGLARLRAFASKAETHYALTIFSTGFKTPEEAAALLTEIRKIQSGLPILHLSCTPVPPPAAAQTAVAVKPLSRAKLYKLIAGVLERENKPEQTDSADGSANRPAKILVVDDSPDNRDLVQVYLMSGPYQLTFEEDGKAAVDRFAIADFDLILMDVQMPVMDGLAATRAIRGMERQLGRNPIPIIVVSANSSLQDMEASNQAGCNVHLAKPLSKSDLINAIHEYERPLERTPAVRYAVPEPILIRIPAGLEELAPAYLVRRKKEVSEMRDLVASSEFSRLATLAHNLKGSGTGYGFPDLTRLGARLNLAARQEDREALQSQINELSTYLERVQIAASVN